jgi:predicted RNA-binding protein
METHNQSNRPRLMIDISPELRRRIKIAAAQRDISIREYVEQILEEAVPEVGVSTEEEQSCPVSRESLERLLRTREEIIQERQGKPFSDSTDLIRQMREERSKYLGEL